MNRVVIIGAGAVGVAAQLEAMGLSAIRTAVEFREYVELLPVEMYVPPLIEPLAPKFGGNRPYLKKKKGRA